VKPALLHGRWPLPWVLAWRYMAGRRSQILSSTAAAALAATSLGVTAMVVALALMTGYTEDLERRLIGLQGDIVASPLAADAFDLATPSFDALRAVPGVERVGRVAYGEGSISSEQAADGISVILRGVGPGALPRGLPAVELGPDAEGIAGIVLGKELQRQLGVQGGDLLRLVVVGIDAGQGGRGVRFRYRTVRCRGAFATGFAEFDARWGVLDLETLKALRSGQGLDVLEVAVAESADPEAIAAEVERRLGDKWLVQRWQALNDQLFAALALQKRMLFFVLGLIVVVSTFNTASTLVILVRERLSDIGVLAALGLAPRSLFGVFTLYGLGLGAAGALGGVAAGGAIAWVLTTFELVRFDPEVAAIYFIDSVPFRVQLVDLLAVAAFTLAVTLVACSLPAWRAARLLPASALRAE
jgi:lipoprotein-releasing system permease protein